MDRIFDDLPIASLRYRSITGRYTRWAAKRRYWNSDSGPSALVVPVRLHWEG
jgi:hypothetical protein